MVKKVKRIIRSFLQKLYIKLVPTHKYAVRIDAAVTDIQNRLTIIEHSATPPASVYTDSTALEKLFLASDTTVYRYLYLLRYMKDNCTVLDIEGEYGTGVDLLYRYTPTDSCTCLNSIGWYTRMGAMYYGKESIQFKTGTLYDIAEKYDIITALHETRTTLFKKEELQRLYDMLEYRGILAFALDSTMAAQIKSETFTDIGFQIEAHLYQEKVNPELLATPSNSAVQVYYLRKYE